MARTYLEAISLMRRVENVNVYSPTRPNREAFVTGMSRRGLNVVPVDTAEEAVRGAEIVLTATNAMGPRKEPDWIDDGSLVLCVTSREVGPELIDRCDAVFQLGNFTIDSGAKVPSLEFSQSGAGGFVAGTAAECESLRWSHLSEVRRFPSLIDVLVGTADGRTRPMRSPSSPTLVYRASSSQPSPHKRINLRDPAILART